MASSAALPLALQQFAPASIKHLVEVFGKRLPLIDTHRRKSLALDASDNAGSELEEGSPERALPVPVNHL
jgi:hypothetical protein